MSTRTNKTDIAVSLTKGVVGAAPFVGPLVAEVVGTLIPNQRLDRIERLVKKLEAKVVELDQDRVQREFKNPEFVVLLEDGFVQASRALSGDRLEYLASLLKNSLSEERLSHLESKRLLALLSELNDMEVILLASHMSENNWQINPKFWEQHEAVLAPRATHFGSSDREFDEEAVYNSYRRHLVQLGLMKPNYRRHRRGDIPEFDEKTGMMKASGHDITRLGYLLLRQIEVAAKNEVAG
jgi:hypothetical protein